MRVFLAWILVPACFLTLFLTCYGGALLGDRQFGYRDAAHYYYPLYQRVQEEWSAGRWPLWEPEENAGMPLLGNPTAAVLYPGKLIFAVLPYPWGVRVYVVVHTALAFGAMLALMRSWRTSWVGSALGALSYAFSAPILFQYSNIIYLVGAAWLPLGFRAVDRWVRLGRRWGLVELAVVLAMQILGGDPQSAYLLGGAAIGYAAGITWSRGWRVEARASRPSPLAPRAGSPCHNTRWWLILLAATGVVIWVAATLAGAKWLPRLRPAGFPPPAIPGTNGIPWVVVVAWSIAGLAVLARWWWSWQGGRSLLGRIGLGLALSAGLAIALTAAQLLPVLEFTQQTARAGGTGPHDLYPFSIEPWRLIELAWPNILGVKVGGNTSWREAFRIPGTAPETWTPSLYLGGLTLVLACRALSVRRGPPWRVWLSVILGLNLVLSLGQFTSPIWATRFLSEVASWRPLRDLLRSIGPLDPAATPPIRLDRWLRDGDGSAYWWVATLLPGFRQFRFPAKLFTFTALGMSALAGLGWDRLSQPGEDRQGGDPSGARSSRATAWLFASVLVTSLVVLAGIGIERTAILDAFRRPAIPSLYGPLDAEGAFRAIARSLIHAVVVSSLGLVVVGQVRRRPNWAGAIALGVMTADLAAANARLVVTVPQAVFEAQPEALRIIQASERQGPSAGPFRIHRMPAWHPPAWQTTTSADRNREMAAWERDTLQPKHGITLGVEYTHTFGVGQLHDHEWFFDGFPHAIRTAEAARVLGVAMGKEVIYFPRRAFDLWNTRYFIVPSYPHGWRDPYRGYASFLFQTDPVFPDPEALRGPDHAGALVDSRTKDFQVFRNRNEAPRAWIVHRARWLSPAQGSSMEARDRALREMIYAGDPIWNDPTRIVFDPRALAWVELDQRAALEPYLSGSARGPTETETVRVTYPSPQRAELEAVLESPGLVILADVDYPGWTLTIDGQPAPIYRVNRRMRGAAVGSGTHRLVYSYAPRSFQAGCVVTVLGLGALALLGVACAVRPVDPVVGAWTGS